MVDMRQILINKEHYSALSAVSSNEESDRHRIRCYNYLKLVSGQLSRETRSSGSMIGFPEIDREREPARLAAGMESHVSLFNIGKKRLSIGHRPYVENSDMRWMISLAFRDAEEPLFDSLEKLVRYCKYIEYKANKANIPLILNIELGPLSRESEADFTMNDGIISACAALGAIPIKSNELCSIEINLIITLQNKSLLRAPSNTAPIDNLLKSILKSKRDKKKSIESIKYGSSTSYTPIRYTPTVTVDLFAGSTLEQRGVCSINTEDSTAVVSIKASKIAEIMSTAVFGYKALFFLKEFASVLLRINRIAPYEYSEFFIVDSEQ